MKRFLALSVLLCALAVAVSASAAMVCTGVLAGETVTFLDKDLPSSVKGLLQPYRFVVSP